MIGASEYSKETIKKIVGLKLWNRVNIKMKRGMEAKKGPF